MKTVGMFTLGAVAIMLLRACRADRRKYCSSAYTDVNEFIDVQILMCSQLAGTFQEDAAYVRRFRTAAAPDDAGKEATTIT